MEIGYIDPRIGRWPEIRCWSPRSVQNHPGFEHDAPTLGSPPPPRRHGRRTLARLPAARAAIPRDTLVIAKNISDIISLDPAEVYEGSAGEVITIVSIALSASRRRTSRNSLAGWRPTGPSAPTRKPSRFRSVPDLSSNPAVPSPPQMSPSHFSGSYCSTRPGLPAQPIRLDQGQRRDLVTASDSSTLQFTVPQQLAPTLVLNVISSTIGSVVEKSTALAHESGGDLGYGWLRSNAAASGAYQPAQLETG